MELTEDESIKSYAIHCGHCGQICYLHMNMNGLVLVVDIT